MSRQAIIETVEGSVVKIPQPYRASGDTAELRCVPGTDYFFEADWDQVYATELQSVLVKITTKGGHYGWGEIQAPIVPEVTATLIEELLGPMVLGANALEIDRLRERLYRSMNVRGHDQGFMIDAISGLDIALWDLAGKLHETPVSTMLGGRHRERLEAYVSLPGFDADELADQAAAAIEDGFTGVKIFAGRGRESDLATVATVRDRIGPDPTIFLDGFRSYTSKAAVQLAADLCRFDVGFLEAPLAPERIEDHATVANQSELPIAIGEPLRTAQTFRRWFEQKAIDIAQPDIVRTGVTEGRDIAAVADSFGVPVAPHFGAALGIGMAATWHFAASIDAFRIQEHQPRCFEVTQRLIEPELRQEAGELVVPDGPGLGIDIDEPSLADYVTDSFHVSVDS